MKATIIRPGQPPKQIEIPTEDRGLGPFVGRWRIVDMALWDARAFDLVEPAGVEIEADGMGSMHFIAVQAGLDVHREDREGQPGISWSWRGWDEGDEVAGRGWATLGEDGVMTGRVYIHRGDASDFRAIRREG